MGGGRNPVFAAGNFCSLYRAAAGPGKGKRSVLFCGGAGQERRNGVQWNRNLRKGRTRTMWTQIAADINILGRFCGKRDVEELTPACLRRTFALEQADVMVLFGVNY